MVGHQDRVGPLISRTVHIADKVFQGPLAGRSHEHRPEILGNPRSWLRPLPSEPASDRIEHYRTPGFLVSAVTIGAAFLATSDTACACSSCLCCSSSSARL